MGLCVAIRLSQLTKYERSKTYVVVETEIMGLRDFLRKSHAVPDFRLHYF